MNKRNLLCSMLVLSLLFISGCSERKKTGHKGHGHSENGHANHLEETHNLHAEKGEHSDLDGEGHGAHANELPEIELAPEFIKMADITLATAGEGTISQAIKLSGEIGFNEDRLAHITPRFAGIVRNVNFRVGEYVDEGSEVATIESNESLTRYSLKTPISGRIIEKHASTGEYVSQEESIYLIADLSTVWVNLAVYPKDAAKVKPGQKVIISASGSDITTEGTIQYVTPVMDPQTRRITARVILQNGDNQWRPGSFVNAYIEIGESEKGLVIDKYAIQVLNEKKVVFIQHEPNTFKPVEVVVGESDSRKIRVLGGLEAGTDYVKSGAFELKAKIVTSSLGAHAGHNH